MKKQLSEQAQVAKLCRQYMKQRGIKGRATSDSYAGGDSVDVTIYDQSPQVKKDLEREFSKYQYGSFNGMEDIYEYDNVNKGIPQTKYLFVRNEYSDELKQQAWEFVQARCPEAKDLPADYKDNPYSAQVYGEWVGRVVYRLLAGGMNGMSEDFWREKLASAA